MFYVYCKLHMPRPNGPVKFAGVTALAKEIGRSTASVSVSLSKGKTVDQIRETARRTDERRKAGKARGKQAGGPQVVQAVPSASPIPTSYVPARHAAGMSPRAVLVPEASVPTALPSPIKYVVNVLDPPPPTGPVSVNYAADVAPVLDENGVETEASANRRKAIALANERELDVKKKRKELLPVREVNAWFAGCIVAARNMFLRIGPELRDRLAAEDDPVKIEALINAEVRRGLAVLKEMPVE